MCSMRSWTPPALNRSDTLSFRVMRLLLISNSTPYGGGYLDHCAEAIVSLAGSSVGRVLFLPYALADRDGYTATARRRFNALGFALESAHESPDGPVRAIERA